MRLKNGRLVDPNVLAKQIADIRVGARLRGLEGTVEGFIDKTNGKPVLRLSKSKDILTLIPLTTKVQIDAIKTKKAEPPTKSEKQAFKALLRRIKDQPELVRVTGPLRTGMKLEVRAFESK